MSLPTSRTSDPKSAKPAGIGGKPALVRAKDACEYLFGCSDQTARQRLYRMIHIGQITGRKVGGTWWVPQTALLEFADDSGEANG